MTDPDSPPKPTVLYGSLYLDRGERTAKIKEQIRDLVKGHPSPKGFFFDVIYGPGQAELADEFVARVVKRARKAFAPGTPISVSKTLADSPDHDPRH